MKTYDYLKIICPTCAAKEGECCVPKIAGDELNFDRFAQCVERLRIGALGESVCVECVTALSSVRHWEHVKGGE